MTNDVPAIPRADAEVPTVRGRRGARRVATVIAVIGLIGCAALTVAILAGRGWASDRVDGLFGDVDQLVGRGGTIADEASSRSAERAAELDAILTTVSGMDLSARVPTALSDRIAAVAAKYDAVRDQYVDIRAQVGAALRTLDGVARVVPGLEVPSGPREALTELDQRLVAIDTTLAGLRASASGAVDATVQRLADAATALRTAVDGVTEVTGRIKTATDDLQLRLDRAHDRIELYLWLGAGGFLVLVLYVALLNVFVIWLARD